ncbi:MAG: hypothetical protein ACPGU1_11460 [Myxococcota bacterium]
MTDRRYPDTLTVRAGRERYFESSGFDTKTYTDRWIKLPLGPVTLYLPNLPARQEAVPLHDVDHVLTGYDATWRGEFQIAAFELGTGLGRYWAGWLLNSQTVILGALLCPGDTLRAFVRGRRCHSSLFTRSTVDDTLLNMTLGALRTELGLDEDTGPPTLSERVAYAGTVATALFANAGTLLLAGWAFWTALGVQ